MRKIIATSIAIQILLLACPLLAKEFTEIIWEEPPDVITLSTEDRDLEFYVTQIKTGKPRQGFPRSKDTYIITELVYFSSESKARVLAEYQALEDHLEKVKEIDNELSGPDLSNSDRRRLGDQRARLVISRPKIDRDPDEEFLIALSATAPIGSEDSKTVIGDSLYWKSSWDHLNKVKAEDMAVFEKAYEWSELVEEGDSGITKALGTINYPSGSALIEMEIKDIEGIESATFNVYWNGDLIVKNLSPDLLYFFLNGNLLKSPVANYINDQIEKREAAEKAEEKDKIKRRSKFD